MRILVATGLQRERRILSGPAVEVVAGGGDQARLEAALEQSAAAGSLGIISIGIAGALAPGLRPGDWVVATAVTDGGNEMPTDPAWSARLVEGLPGSSRGLLLGTDVMVPDAKQKAALHRTTDAAAVDMESHVAMRVAGRHRLPFAAARVVSDAADRTLPPAARVGMRPDGGVDLPRVLHSLLAEPRQLGALIRTALEAEQGFRALRRGHRLLGARLAGPRPGADLGELPLDVA